VRYLVRSRDLPGLRALIPRVRALAQGAALMTETSVEERIVSAVADKMPNEVMKAAMQAAVDRLGPPQFDEADRAFAREIQKTLTPNDIRADYQRVGMRVRPDAALCDFPVKRETTPEAMIGSTDVGDVSWVVPTVEVWGATHAIGTPAHSWQQVAQGKAPAAHKGMVWAAKVMASTAIDMLENPKLLADAKAELAERTAQTPYESLMTPDVRPALRPRPDWY
jgi:aminobenzoyl-glutamate utilization protein B